MTVRLDMEWDMPAPPGAEAMMRRVAAACGAAEGLTLPAYAQVRLTGDAAIRDMNRAYRHIDRATDVLSFPSTPAHPGKTLGGAEQWLRRERDETGACFLGDIVISLDHAKAQAAEYGHSLDRELGYLTAHALFHLMGYDHMEQKDQERMRTMEEKALNQAGVNRVTDEELIARATEAMAFSYSPYSHFKVGAALLARDGRVFTGCNVENGSYGATNCAERTALFKAVSEGAREFSVIAIAAEKAMPWPCGICRQALNEFAPDLRVIVSCGEERGEALLPDLLPHGFGPKQGTLDFLAKE